jgi:hypothetical protein
VTTLPDSNGVDSAEERYEQCIRWWNVVVSRYNSAVDSYDAAEREMQDAEHWLNEARGELNRAASVVGLPGAP